ncbi:unnamed protein product [Cercopithifilaria johnstoni]|uniref:Uncharacterized protein n=1 Tax=Cercopithifilaria johnstoni TaxID=2874296 RepID=A0A8J2M0B6_9BILA|nr:unnamed protein product [Cercopithifilaria johnstoni]
MHLEEPDFWTLLIPDEISAFVDNRNRFYVTVVADFLLLGKIRSDILFDNEGGRKMEDSAVDKLNDFEEMMRNPSLIYKIIQQLFEKWRHMNRTCIFANRQT